MKGQESIFECQKTTGRSAYASSAPGRAGMIHARNFARGVSRAPAGRPGRCPRADAAGGAARSWRSRPATRTTGRRWRTRVSTRWWSSPRPSLHREVVVQAARAGKHVLCEKPMAMDVRECDEMIDACDAARVKLQIGFMRRYDESFRAAKERVDGGRDRRGGAGEVPHPRAERAAGVDVRHPQEQRPPGGGEQPRHRRGALVRRQRDRGSLRHRRQLPLPAGGAEIPRLLRQRGHGLPVRRRAGRDSSTARCRWATATTRAWRSSARAGVMFVGRREQDFVVGCSTAKGIVQPFVKSWRTLFTRSVRPRRTRTSWTASWRTGSRACAASTAGWPWRW